MQAGGSAAAVASAASERGCKWWYVQAARARYFTRAWCVEGPVCIACMKSWHTEGCVPQCMVLRNLGPFQLQPGGFRVVSSHSCCTLGRCASHTAELYLSGCCAVAAILTAGISVLRVVHVESAAGWVAY
jgi:hypothetical protein